eukprot:4216379-Amphidinium_carterae.2
MSKNKDAEVEYNPWKLLIKRNYRNTSKSKSEHDGYTHIMTSITRCRCMLYLQKPHFGSVVRTQCTRGHVLRGIVCNPRNANCDNSQTHFRPTTLEAEDAAHPTGPDTSMERTQEPTIHVLCFCSECCSTCSNAPDLNLVTKCYT